jgi:SAM-dependent methyltransferase
MGRHSFPPRPKPFVDRTVAFLRRGLPRAPATVLEVGCGRGEVAERLMRLGYHVTAIDVNQSAVAATRRRGVPAVRADIRTFQAEPFDSILCIFSLHHLSPLSVVGDKLRALLRPGGRLLVSDFAWEEADGSTAAFYFDLLRTLVMAGIARPSRELPSLRTDPRMAWRNRHLRPERLHTGRAMVRMLQGRFVVHRVERGPFLYGILGGAVPGSLASKLTLELLQVERRRIADGSIRPIGLDLVVHRPRTEASGLR